jgi:hypothetical protein
MNGGNRTIRMAYFNAAPARSTLDRPFRRALASSISFLVFLFICCCAVAAQTPAETSASKVSEKSCRRSPLVIGKCFTVHARLSVYNGAPALRLWKIGTHRMLGVSEQRFSLAGYRNIPIDIESQIDQSTAIFGDFLVCPFTRPVPGEMRMICIESGKNLVRRDLN